MTGPYYCLIARVTGRPLKEVLLIPALEYNQWVRHFDRYPFGEYHSQKILASMWFLLASYLGTKITTEGGTKKVLWAERHCPLGSNP